MILNAIPENVKDFLLEIEKLGFRLCLVGGAVRNVLSGIAIGNDLDFEVRFKSEVTDLDWPEKFQLISKLAADKNLKYENLPYLIIRIFLADYSLEFSSPRVENFHENNHHHHNFEAFLSSNLNYKEAFKRRDFTINAIGAELDLAANRFQYVDPFNGQAALKAKILEKISDDFFYDSVRFIRLVRFKTNLDFEISPAILGNINKFNLTKISDYHFKQEAKKSDIGKFFNEFIELVQNNQMQLSARLKFIENIKFKFPKRNIINFEHLIYFTFFQDETIANEFIEFFQYPKNYFSKLTKLKLAITYFNNLSYDDFYKKLEMPLIEFKNSIEFTHLKVILDYLNMFEQLLQYTSTANYISIKNLNQLKLFKLDDIIRNQQPPELRSVMEMQEGLKNVFK